ncbi:MAG: hypothetical protein ACI30B_06920 [Paludibacteraceae bacterium]
MKTCFKIILISLVIIFFFWGGAVVSAHCFGFYVNEKDIIITFIGILATFVVINNFYQVEEAKVMAEKQIKEMSVTAEKRIKEITKYEDIVKKLLISSKEYIVAMKIVQQNKISNEQKVIWKLTVKSKRIEGDWVETFNVKIKNVSLDGNGELKWCFMDVENIDASYLKDRDLVSIYEETLDLKDLECNFENSYFVSLIKIMLDPNCNS